MKLSFCLIVILHLVSAKGCTGQAIISNSSSWINLDYINCLENELPCACEKQIKTYFSISLDTSKVNWEYGIALSKFSQLEPYYYPIREVNTNEYEVLEIQKTISFAHLKIIGDTLYFIKGSETSLFIRSKEYTLMDPYFYLIENVNFLNKALELRGNHRIQSIVGYDSLRLDCNKWLDNKNILSVKGKPYSWVIAIAGDSLNINKIINPERDPLDPVQTELFRSYKWR